jgi:hypothetical protein
MITLPFLSLDCYRDPHRRLCIDLVIGRAKRMPELDYHSPKPERHIDLTACYWLPACEKCGKRFINKSKLQRFCSKHCANSRKRRQQLN